jgi:hypothetical protein
MDSFVYDSQMLKQIEDLLMTAGRNDLVQYLRYVKETLDSFDDFSDSDEEEEEHDVGKTDDGFYYLK